MPFDEQAFNDALADLGGTPDEVAESLRRLGIKGKRKSGETCPLAYFIAAKFGDVVTYAEVDTCGVEIEIDRGNADLRWVDFASPCEQFVVRFDKGEYPDLVSPQEVPSNGD